jgi:putative redox protein
LHYRVSGDGLTDAAVARAVRLSAEKYCSASIMLARSAEITHDYEVLADVR